jgi:hypothetical protein
VNWFKRIKNGTKIPAAKPKKENCFFGIRLQGGGAILFEGPLNELRFPEKLVIAKSVLFFDDPEPCFIHRSAVVARLFAEINLLLEAKSKIPLAELSESCSGYFDEYPGAEIIKIFKGGASG